MKAVAYGFYTNNHQNLCYFALTLSQELAYYICPL